MLSTFKEMNGSTRVSAGPRLFLINVDVRKKKSTEFMRYYWEPELRCRCSELRYGMEEPGCYFLRA